LLFGGLYVYRLLTYDRIYSGVLVEGTDMGGCTREQVLQFLNAWQAKLQEKTLIACYKDVKFQIGAGDIDLKADTGQANGEIWNFGRTGAWWERIRRIWEAAQNSYRITVLLRYNENKLAKILDGWRQKIDKAPRNAVLSMASGEIIPQEQGVRLEEAALSRALLKAFQEPNENIVVMPVVPVFPKITTDALKQAGIRKALSIYSTTFNGEDSNRTANIKEAAERVNGQLLYPGDVFSFNSVVGPREKKYGFKEALEIADGEFVPGIGGGVCQVSSTLYNAVLLADLEIMERYNHSKPLNYVPLGQDAAVAYNVLDFKFRNNTAIPLMVLAEVRNNKLTVGIYGRQRLKEQVEIAVANMEVILPNVVKKEDPRLPIGESKLETKGKDGYKVTTVRVIRKNGKEIRREVLAEDSYLPDDTVIKIGTMTQEDLRNRESIKVNP
jgi:vancomycin resistance protein YoaR